MFYEDFGPCDLGDDGCQGSNDVVVSFDDAPAPPAEHGVNALGVESLVATLSVGSVVGAGQGGGGRGVTCCPVVMESGRDRCGEVFVGHDVVRIRWYGEKAPMIRARCVSDGVLGQGGGGCRGGGGGCACGLAACIGVV